LILPHNIDLMHQEHNVAESIMDMCLDVTGFTKDNMNARKDLTTLCDTCVLLKENKDTNELIHVSPKQILTLMTFDIIN
jgi:hypothetical protein